LEPGVPVDLGLRMTAAKALQAADLFLVPFHRFSQFPPPILFNPFPYFKDLL
jgi:hypothetical protein